MTPLTSPRVRSRTLRHKGRYSFLVMTQIQRTYIGQSRILQRINVDNEIKPALLTRTEIEWLLGKKHVSKAYEYYLKHSIKEKLRTLTELEIPLLKQKGMIGDAVQLSTNSNNLRANSKDEWCGRWDSNPRTPERLEPQSSAFGHAGRLPH